MIPVSTVREVLFVAGLLIIMSGCTDSPIVSVPPVALSRVTTGLATWAIYTGAILNATVYPRGAQTEYFFELGTTTSYGTRTGMQSAGAGTDPVAVSATVSGLILGTVYHFRACVVIPTPDTTRGEDRSAPLLQHRG